MFHTESTVIPLYKAFTNSNHFSQQQKCLMYCLFCLKFYHTPYMTCFHIAKPIFSLQSILQKKKEEREFKTNIVQFI